MPVSTFPNSVKETDSVVTGIIANQGTDELLLSSFQCLTSPVGTQFRIARYEEEIKSPETFRLGFRALHGKQQFPFPALFPS